MFTGTARDRGVWFDSLFVDHAVLRLGWTNFGTVIPGKLYRGNHPTPGRLRRLHDRYGLRTLINLRGKRDCGSDALSRDAAARLGMVHIDMGFESRGAPQRDRVLRFYDIYQTLEFPALMHCKSGADRTGLAGGLAVLFEGGTAAEALGQLSLRFGHFKQSPTGILDAFFLHFQATAEGRISFIEWIRNEYNEHLVRAHFRAHGLATFLNDAVLRRE